ncbi:24-dehydrocholesterol reductase-like protein precursor [Westerdykella ornata]|uniref:Delta(24)-sterol reductase n=1 Tax=Westerdykella ornata TaxID=318751 RepID=A0A6A6JHW2_WESOR|nr:24-dehydrocholesterol reductase-like protein precursor [Westerdykella ornata]KAF2275784.1 24-dehydrocholesterol reductase-like protein precursor [Westerdykella ornata]
MLVSDEHHKSAVADIAEKTRQFHQSRTPFRIYHGSTLSTRVSARKRDQIIDVSALNRVIHFDESRKRVLVEPNVPMDALVTATTAHGLLPQIVMELPNITVGGGFSGTSGESSSFRYGLFDRTIKAAEIVLGNGDVVWASEDDPETRELLLGCAGSCGTLGIITLLEMQLVEAKSYVELIYIPVSSVQESLRVLEDAEKDPSVDYMDGILFSMNSGVIMIGRLTDTPLPERKPQTFDKAADPWFYLHAEAILKRTLHGNTPYKETIPVKSYLFRYDRGVFWSGLRAFKYFMTPFNRLTRYLLDPFMYTRTMIHALHRSGLSSQTIIQDLAVPYRNAEDFIRWTDERTGLWPLWLCPVKPSPPDAKNFSMGKNIGQDMLLDVGIWGMGPRDPHEFIRLNRDFEAKVEELGGLKCLYAHAYYTEDEFWRIYDEDRYMALRRRWHAESLPSVYDKVKVDLKGVAGGEEVHRKESWVEWARRRIWDIYPLGGLYGIASATKGLLVQSDFLLKK